MSSSVAECDKEPSREVTECGKELPLEVVGHAKEPNTVVRDC